MTAAINYFQAIFMFKHFTTTTVTNKAEVELAIELKSEAQTLAAVADQEMHNGRTAQELSAAAQTVDKRRIFAEIAVWHFTRAAEKYGKAAARFGEAGRIHVKKIRGFNNQAQEMRRRAAQAETALGLLNDLTKQN